MEKESTQEEVKKKKDRRGRRKLEVEKREEARRGKCGQVTLTVKKRYGSIRVLIRYNTHTHTHVGGISFSTNLPKPLYNLDYPE